MVIFLWKLPLSDTPYTAPWAILAQGDEHQCELLDFLADLNKSSPQSFKRITAVLDRASKTGPRFYNTESCKSLKGMGEGEFLEFRCKVKGGHNVRILGFVDEGRFVICTHGFAKKTDKTPAKEEHKLIAAYKAYMQAKENNQIFIGEDLNNE